MPWITRGIREGIVTTRYPRRPDSYGQGFRATVRPVEPREPLEPAGKPALREIAAVCPTGAIAVTDHLQVDAGRCVACGRCVELAPEWFAYDPDFEVATLNRELLVVPPDDEGSIELSLLRADLDRRVKALRRSIHIRHVDCGSDGAEEWEIAALNNPIYDIQRLGVYFTASPRHADLLLVTGAGSIAMAEVLRHTYDVMPDPKIVIAVGTDSISGGLFADSYATLGGAAQILRPDVFIPGSPPSPFSILHGIALGIGLIGSQENTK